MSHVHTFLRDPLLTIANHFQSLVVAFVGLILLAAFLFSLVEPVSFGHAVYWAITTATTTGYGDISPASGLGMAIANALQVSGLILGAFLVAHVLDRLRKDEHKFTEQEQMEIRCETQAIINHFGIEVDYSENGCVNK
jgi:voltage-gated potassium channel